MATSKAIPCCSGNVALVICLKHLNSTFFSDYCFPPTPHILLWGSNVWTITSDLKQRQEEDECAVNHKQGQHGVTDLAGFQSIQRERLFTKHELHKSQDRKNTPTFNAIQELYLFLFVLFFFAKWRYVTASVCLSDFYENNSKVRNWF